MASIANLLVSLKADFGDAESKFDSFINKMHELDNKEEDTEDHLRHLKHGAEEGGGGLEHLKEIFSDLGSEIVTFGAETLGLISIFEALKESVEVSAQLESSRVALESFTGSAEEASKVIEDMEGIAKSEALAFPEIVPAAQHMMALGFSAENMEKAIKAAGNASWALGTPLESVSQRMAQMAMSGMANARMLRTLGVSSEDLARIMGVSVGEVTKTFKVLDQETRLDVLTEAMGKFGDQGAKQAETVKGKWVELKNTWHEVFAEAGDGLESVTRGLLDLGTNGATIAKEIIEDVKGIGEEFPILAHLAVTASQVIIDAFALVADSLSNDKNIDALKIFNDSISKGITYAEASKQAHLHPEEEKPQEHHFGQIETPIGEQWWRRKPEVKEGTGVIKPAIPAEGETGPLGDIKGKVQEARGPLEAKEAAGVELARITGRKETVKQTAALAREAAEAEIAANHIVIQSNIDKYDDIVTKGQATAQEEERVAKEKAARIGTINAGEAKALENLIGQERPLKIAQTYQPQEDESKRATQIQEINIKTDNEIAKNKLDLAAKQQKLQDGITSATVKGNATMSKDVDKVLKEMTNKWFEFFNKITENSNRVTDIFIHDTEKLIESQDKVGEAQLRGNAEAQVLKLKAQEITLEGQYARELSHTHEQELAHIKEIADLEARQRQERLRDLAVQLHDLGPRSQDTDQTAEKRASLEAQVQAMSLENQNAQITAANDYLTVIQKQNNMLQAQKTLAQFTQEGKNIDLGSVMQSIVQEFARLPQVLGNTLSHAIFNHQRGDSTGKQLGQAFRQMGQQLLGDVFQKGIHSIMSSLLGSLGKSLTQTTQITATAALTSAVVANTAAMLGNTGVTAAGTGVTAAHTGVMTAHLGVMVSHLGTMIANTAATIANTVATIWNSLVQMVKSVLGFLGLAGGGDLEVGRPTLVGEKGPELIIPRGAGTVIPNDKTQDLLAASLFNTSPASSLSAHTNSLEILKNYTSNQGNPTQYRSGDTNISLHGANFYGVSNTREMMRQIADYSRNQKIGQSYNTKS